MGKVGHIHRVSITVPHAAANLFAEMIEPHVDSVSWTAMEGFAKAEVIGFAEHPPDEAGLITAIAVAAEAADVLKPDIEIGRIEIRDWVLDNLKQFPPLHAGRFFVHGADYEGSIPAASIALQIPAGAAFGTGDHGSTKGCLLAIDAINQGFCGRALDMGCGSGILAIAIAKRWRVNVTASDIDPVAVKTATENVAGNQVNRLVRTVTAPGYRHPAIGARRYDLIVSNILARPLAKLAKDLGRHLLPGGWAVLSGLLESDGNWVLAAHRNHGMRLVERIHVDGWLTLMLRKSPSKVLASKIQNPPLGQWPR